LFVAEAEFGKDGPARVIGGPARFQSVEAALAAGPMFYADIVEGIGSDDAAGRNGRWLTTRPLRERRNSAATRPRCVDGDDPFRHLKPRSPLRSRPLRRED
jgi:hypothetical protein